MIFFLHKLHLYICCISIFLIIIVLAWNCLASVSFLSNMYPRWKKWLFSYYLIFFATTMFLSLIYRAKPVWNRNLIQFLINDSYLEGHFCKFFPDFHILNYGSLHKISIRAVIALWSQCETNGVKRRFCLV